MKSKIIAILFLTLCIPALFSSCCKEEYCPKKYAGVYSCKVSKYERHMFNPIDTFWENKTKTATIKYIDDSTFLFSIKLEKELDVKNYRLLVDTIGTTIDTIFVDNRWGGVKEYFTSGFITEKCLNFELLIGNPRSGIYYVIKGTKIL